MQGNAPITPETAMILERITGTPASFWNRREADYRETLLRITPKTLSSEDEEWLKSLPIKELQKRHRLPAVKDRTKLLDAALTFFGVADHKAFQRIWRGPVASFRCSNAFGSHPGAVISWLRIAQIDAQSAKVEPFSAARFRKALYQIRSLTAHGDPNEIVNICANAGVAVVFIPEVQRCRISGAAWWASPTRAILALSDRYKRDDHFWFTFFHEAAHLLLHSKKETFVDDDSDNDILEDEANRFARDILIPPDRATELPTLLTDADVKRFAADIGIAPGIVVGRLQHDKIWDYNQGHRLKLPIHIVES
jgi:HTH-type transcriptional regulator/antitoxin HigA